MKEKTGEAPAEDLEKIKTFLGEAAVGYTDGQLPQLYQDIFAMAELLLDLYLARKHGKSSWEEVNLTGRSHELLLK